MTASRRTATIEIRGDPTFHWHSVTDVTVIREAVRRWADGRVETGLRLQRAWMAGSEPALETWFEWRV